jgi:cytochrome b6-f complex iron-sulfur subunit
MRNEERSTCAGCGTRPEGAPATGIGRRTFLAQSAVLAAIAALNACGAADGGGFTAPDLSGSSGSGATTIKVSTQPALATVGGVALVTLAGSPFAIVRTGATTFLALSRVCPHQGSIVNKTSNGFLCPNHGAQYSSTGQWVGGQRTSSLRSYTTSYDATTDTLTVS